MLSILRRCILCEVEPIAEFTVMLCLLSALPSLWTPPADVYVYVVCCFRYYVFL